MKKTVLVLIIIFAAEVFSFAQTKNALSSNSQHELVPIILTSAEQKPIVLSDLRIDVEIVGNFAFTTYDMVFYNPNQVAMEGEFIMPLAKNQNVSAIALDINGKMRDGAIVEKKKVESAVIKSSAAVSVQQNDGNRFKTKVHQFNPQSTRRIKITVEESLTLKDNAYIYNLPLKFNTRINFNFNIEIPSELVKGMPIAEMDSQNFIFRKGNNVLKAGFSQNNYLLDSYFYLVVPKQKEEPIFTHKEGKNTYFYSDINIKVSSKNRVLPKTAAIVWDSSVSSQKRNIKRELALLDTYFKKSQNIEIVFVKFDIKMSSAKNYVIEKGNWSQLKKDISRIVYDGATCFDKLKFDDFRTDEILLFTDGINSLGKTTRIAIGKIPIYAINSSAEFNLGALTEAAVKSGGSFINLNSVSDKKAAELLTKRNLKLISYSFDKNKIKEIYPQHGTPLQENFTVAGILTSDESEITLTFGYDKNDIVSTKTIKLHAKGDNPAVERLWAVKKIKELELDSDKNEKEILRLSKKYLIVTDLTSLLVLENATDYATHKIIPPKELLAEYNNIISMQEKEEKERKTAAIEDAVLQVHDIKEWWKHDYSREKQPAANEKIKTAFGVRQEEIFKNTIPSASEGEVKAPSVSQNSSDSAINKTFALQNFKTVKDGQTDIKIKTWDPQVPYMKIIKNSFDEEMYFDYLKLKAGYGYQPSFYFDIAGEFIGREMKDEAIVILSNIVEMKIDSPELLRITAYKLMEAGSYSYAVDVFEKIVNIRAEHPQSYRDLALAYQANKEYKKALDTFYKILTKNWERFQSIKQIVFVEMNNLIALYPKISLSAIDKRLIFAMPVDVRIVLGWSTDDTDIDIHIKDPHNEEAYYGNRFTNIGGKLSEDLTQGFGPEEFMLKNAVNGKYEVSIDYFSNDKQSTYGPMVLYLDLYTFYAAKKQTHKRIIIRTENIKEGNIIGTLDFKKSAK
ncbi:MAG: hypothetical protein LBD46_07570 [Endomicrobium sp.]|nr:hypothetical protein [Endomicrobium sp.]